MSTHYDLKPNIKLPKVSDLRDQLTHPEDAAYTNDLIATVEVVDLAEFDACGITGATSLYSPSDLTTSEVNFVDTLPDHSAGSFSIPNKQNSLEEPDRFAFVLDKTHLIFIDEGRFATEILDTIASLYDMGKLTTSHCLATFIKSLLMDDLEFLGNVEDEMEDLEERMLVKDEDVDILQIMEYRRRSIRLEAYYQQLGTMCTMLADNENKLMTKEDARLFVHMASLSDRLCTRAQTLKEYSLQLQELYQTRVDLKQNSIMQTFTIVTVLFAPLTLITGWFGMNLDVLPGTSLPFMFAILIGGAILCTTALLMFFHKKGWL